MILGCSLCGWKDLTLYKSESSFKRFFEDVMLSTQLDYYEMPFLLNITYGQDFFECSRGYVYSVHASKYIFEKSIDELKKYFLALNEFCIKLCCRYVVVHNTAAFELRKLEMAILCMKDAVISIENVTLNSFDVFFRYSQYCKMTIDISHLVYLKQVDLFYKFQPDNISHFHIRGFSPHVRYVTLSNNRSILISKIIEQSVGAYSCPLVLEYPYENLDQLQKDINILKLKEKKHEF